MHWGRLSSLSPAVLVSTGLWQCLSSNQAGNESMGTLPTAGKIARSRRSLGQECGRDKGAIRVTGPKVDEECFRKHEAQPGLQRFCPCFSCSLPPFKSLVASRSLSILTPWPTLFFFQPKPLHKPTRPRTPIHFSGYPVDCTQAVS